jgi:thiamine-monophosphate kinase
MSPRRNRRAPVPGGNARRRVTVAEAGEFGLLDELLPALPGARDVLVGPGDDCAVVALGDRRLLLTVDTLVEGVHFRRGWLTPRQLGRRAFEVNASDVAAMGGVPRWCVLSLAAPATTPAGDLAAISRGVAAAAVAAGARLVGGNLSRARELSVALTLVGEAPAQPVTRAGARPGDLLFVTGSLGEAALGVRLLRRDPDARGAPVRRFRAPRARVRAGALLAGGGLAAAMIDVSDGLLQDLTHLCVASGVGARVELSRVPCSARVRHAGRLLALAGGEDYELLCAIPARHRGRVERLARRFGCPFTYIGVCVPPPPRVRVVDGQGRPMPVSAAGHDHFLGRRR